MLMRVLFITYSAAAIMGCAAHSGLVPLGKGNLEVNAGAGGPFITVSSVKIPTPYLTFGGSYGLSERVNADATIHLTSFFYKIAGFDIGTTWFPVLNDDLIPTWGIQPRLFVLASMKSGISDRYRIYPLISNTAAWKSGPVLAYAGFDLVVPFTKPDYDKESPDYIISPFAGYRWELGNSLHLLTELKWTAANVPGDKLAAGYIAPGGRGALAVMFSISRSF